MHYNFNYAVGHNGSAPRFYNSLLAATVKALESECPITIYEQPIIAEFASLEELVGDIMRNPCGVYDISRVTNENGAVHEHPVMSSGTYKDVCHWLIDRSTQFVFYMYTFRRGGSGIYQLECENDALDFIKIIERQ